MMQLRVPINNLPINLVLLSDGTLAFIRDKNMKTLFCDDGGVSATFTKNNFWLDDVMYDYDSPMDYKENEKMLKWLQAQNLEMPTFV